MSFWVLVLQFTTRVEFTYGVDVDMSGNVIASVIAENLRKFRKKAKLRLSDLEQRTGIAKSHISRFESGGRCPTVESLVKLAKGLKINYKRLLEGVE